ncbi:NAD(P)-dependent oxidoreductase [Dongia rigui]|uniref:precorrin-2 dehydrogenase n=1 Tax=Dongia rigui TaxID=940149 RepID=A0ABU5E3K9_9PROT|nr:NAD(P)-dependent oxidoreductase [Dongia rigui]MDY0874059.1 NAD(P)-dependent oxidoreductase [Dongia rigui]
MRSFPLFMRLQGRPVLLVGQGDMAAAKARLLTAAGASVIERTAVEFKSSDVAGMALVVSAIGDDARDAEVSAAARDAHVPVNVVDRPELSDFTMPAIVDRGEIVVAISTHGGSPVLAQRVRSAVEAALPHGIERLVSFARRFRSAVHARIDDHDRRRHFWAGFFDGPIAKALLAGRERDAAREVIRAINGDLAPEHGAVVELLVDAQDADQITLGDLRALQQADVVLFDADIAPEIVDLARRDAVRAVWQGQEIVAGQRVVRLKARTRASHGQFKVM